MVTVLLKKYNYSLTLSCFEVLFILFDQLYILDILYKKLFLFDVLFTFNHSNFIINERKNTLMKYEITGLYLEFDHVGIA